MKLKKKIVKIFKTNYNKKLIFDLQENKEFTYSSVLLNIKAISKFLQKYNLKKRDKVAVILDNNYLTAHIYLTLYLDNFICLPINPQTSKKNVSSIIKENKIKLIVTSERYEKILHNNFEKNIVNFLSIEKIFLLINNNKSKINKIDALKYFEKKLSKINFNSTQLKIYTSGTTGASKPVNHSYKNLYVGAKSFINFYKIKNMSTFWNYLPMSYLGGYFNLLFLPLYSGGRVVVSKPFNSILLLSCIKIIKKYKINFLWFTPDIANSFIEFIRNKRDINFIKNSKITFLIGMDYVSQQLKEKFNNKFKKYLFENYGLSETLFLSCDKSKKITNNSGTILRGTKIIIKKENRSDEYGEIIVKKSPIIKNGTFNTGDLGKLKNGKIYFQSRKKNILIKGGINISPLEIESLFNNFSIISKCCLLETKNSLGQKKLILIFKKSLDYKKNDYLKKIRKYALLVIEPNKRPDFFYEINNFPLTSSGKVKRNILNEWIKKLKINNDAIFKNKQGKIKKIQLEQKSHLSREVVKVNEASSVKLNNKVYDLKNKGENIITLSLGEAFFKLPKFSLRNLPHNKLNHYSHSRGLISLRRKISDYYYKNFDYRFDPETEILITAGSKAAVFLSLKSILNPGDEVIILEPFWVSFSEQIKLCGAVPISVPHFVSIYDVKRYLSKKTKAIIINSPNNPSGKIYSFEELDYLYELSVANNIFCISDEAYSDFMPKDKKFLTLGNFEEKKKNLIITNSLSKNFSLSGWRIGYVIANKNLIFQMLKLNQHLITCAPTILQYYLVENFSKLEKITKNQIELILKKREKIKNYLIKKKIDFLKGDSTFYFFLSIKPSKLSSEKFQEKILKKFKVAIVSGSGYGNSCRKFIRLSFGTESLKRIFAGIDKIKKLINETK